MAKLNLRLEEGLRKKLQRAADREGRSMQTEIIHRLEMSFRAEGVREDLTERLSMIEKKLKEILGHEGTS